MNKVKFKALLFIISAYSGQLFAGCDSCMQAAAQSANTSITTAVKQVDASTQNAVTQTKALTQAIKTAETSIVTILNANHQQYLQSLSAAASQIVGQIAIDTKTLTNLSDHELKSLVQTLSEVTTAKLKIENDKEFSPTLAQPASGDIMSDRTIFLKEGRVQQEQLTQAIMDAIHTYNDEGLDKDGGMSRRITSALASEDDDAFDASSLSNTTLIKDPVSAENIKKHIMLITNAEPVPRLTGNQSTKPNAADYELNRKVWNARMEITQQILVEEMLSKTGTIKSGDWQNGYMGEVENDSNGNTSLIEAMRGEVDGRLMTPGWYQNMKEMSTTGVTRELVYQGATQLKLMYMLLKKTDASLRLAALRATIKLDHDKTALNNAAP